MNRFLKSIALASFCLSFAFSACDRPQKNVEEINEPLPETPLVEVSQTDPPVVETTLPEEMLPSTIAWTAVKKEFGQVETGKELLHKFTFRNTGENPLKLLNVKTSCQCTTPRWSQEAIQPGEEGFVEALFTPKNAGQFTKTVTVTTNTAERNTVLSISGEAVGDASQ